MKVMFDKTSKYFFRIAGVITTLGAFPVMISPIHGLRLTTGLSFFEESPQLTPIVGHWGIMVVGIGILLFLSATKKSIRKTTVIFSTAEKSYMVGFSVYNFAISSTYAMYYIIPLVGDFLMVTGGIWYLIKSNQLKQE
jgi:hypothetical protein